MLRNMKALEGYSIGATDGTVDQVKDFYLDDQAWGVRCPVVDTGTWLANAYARTLQARHKGDDPHLCSCNAVVGYHIYASDGYIGHVWGLLMDEETGAIRYMVVDTSNWWLGHNVLIAPPWIKDLNWVDGTVSVDLTRQAVKDAPAYDEAAQLNRAQELSLHEYYGKPGYWTNEMKRETDISRK